MRSLLRLIIILWITSAISQNKQVLYGMTDLPQNLLLNPGSKIPQKMHFGVPFYHRFILTEGPQELMLMIFLEIQIKILIQLFAIRFLS